MPKKHHSLLEIKDLEVVFAASSASIKAVRGVSFDLERGEILAIVGESGSGKSTLAMAIARLLPANAQIRGHIHFEEHNILSLDKDKVAQLRGKRIATIFQDPAATLDPVFSIGFQVDEILRLYEPTMSKQQRHQRALELLDFVGIVQADKRLKHFPHQFSGGQLQRIMIACALAGRPEILIADEPTTALDVTVQQEILDLLYYLNRQIGMTILLITHDMGVVADIANRVIVMKEGEIIETAEVETIFKAPKEAYSRNLLAAVPQNTLEQFPKNMKRNGDKNCNENKKLEQGSDNSRVGETIKIKTASSIILQADKLCLAYHAQFGQARDVVHDVSFYLKKGEFVGLVGESGSGKTTIGRSLLGLIKPKSGQLMLEGELLYGKSHLLQQHRAKIGAVFQNPTGSLNPRLTIGQSIAEPLVTHLHMTRGERNKRVAQLLEQVDLLPQWADRYPAELSGGQCQRVAIARSLAMQPSLLVVDEPTSALDVSIQAGILKLLRVLQTQFHFACLFISHDLAVVRNLCQKVIVLNKGAIVEQGETEDVFSNPQSNYTRRLIASAPMPNPQLQAQRRKIRQQAQANP